VCADATAPTEAFVALVGRGAFDLAASHMFLEHVRDPDAVHRNLYAALRPGGRAVHAYPVRNNLPLAANAALPEAVSRRIVRIAQPERDLAGSLGKFPAFYRRCHAPSARARRYFEGFGFEVERHEGYAGHDYYRRVPLLGALERLNRRLVVAAQAPWICFAVLVLRKPAAA
jgi:SAM-dependent methyltransferase